MSLSEKLGVKKSNFIGLIIVAAAVIYGFIDYIIHIINGATIGSFYDVANIVIYALILFFAIYGYKIPNGKMLKYVYLLFALKLGLSAGLYARLEMNAMFILTIAAVILSAFIGGRLPRTKENKINCVVFLALILAAAIIRCVNINFTVVGFNHFIQALALVAAYFARAVQYKENSGILDDK